MLYIATCYSSNQWSGRVGTWSDTLCRLHLLVANRHELSIRRGIHAPLANAQRVFPRQEDIGDDLVAPAVVINPAVIATSWSWKTWKQRSLNSLLSQLKATTSTRGLLSSRPFQSARSASIRRARISRPFPGHVCFCRTRTHLPRFFRDRATHVPSCFRARRVFIWRSFSRAPAHLPRFFRTSAHGRPFPGRAHIHRTILAPTVFPQFLENHSAKLMQRARPHVRSSRVENKVETTYKHITFSALNDVVKLYDHCC